MHGCACLLVCIYQNREEKLRQKEEGRWAVLGALGVEENALTWVGGFGDFSWIGSGGSCGGWQPGFWFKWLSRWWTQSQRRGSVGEEAVCVECVRSVSVCECMCEECVCELGV